MNKWKWFLAILLLLAIGIWRGQALLADKTSQVNSSIPTVQTEKVQQEQKEQILQYSGTVLADQDAVVGAEINGRVEKVLVQNGAVVKKGQALVLLDNSDYKISCDLAEANLQKAQTALSLARTNVSRLQVLYEQKAVSAKDFEDAQAGLKIAAADEKAAQAAYAQAGRALQKATVLAPIDGVIYSCTVLPGQMASPGVPLMMIADTSQVEITFNIPQQDVNIIPNQDAAAQIKIDGQDKVFQGRLSSVSPVANPAARSFEARVRADNPDRLLKPGMFVQISLHSAQLRNIVTIPANAVLDIEGEHYVFVAKKGKAHKRKVQTGEYVNDRLEILSGLRSGEELIVSRVNRLQDQDPIHIKQ